MNWNQLKEQIEKMTPEQRTQDVRFIEPYDKQRAGYCLDLVYAEQDLTVDGWGEPSDEPQIVFVEKGQPFLA
jgi:hypothetical protein